MYVIVRRHRNGYVFLVSVLMISAIVISITISLLLLGLSAEMTGSAVEQSAQAMEIAQSCAERAILSLQQDINYAGNETLAIHEGTCVIHTIGGSGNASRTICIEGMLGRHRHVVEIAIQLVKPSTTIQSFREVQAITLCPS